MKNATKVGMVRFIEGILSQLFIVFVLRTAVPETSSRRPVPLVNPSQAAAKNRNTFGYFRVPESGPSLTLILVCDFILLRNIMLPNNAAEYVL